jgi:hypothetical protein
VTPKPKPAAIAPNESPSSTYNNPAFIYSPSTFLDTLDDDHDADFSFPEDDDQTIISPLSTVPSSPAPASLPLTDRPNVPTPPLY